MSQQLTFLEDCIRDAHIDDQAVELLRVIIRGAASSAPVEALVEMSQSLVDIRRRDLRRDAERN